MPKVDGREATKNEIRAVDAYNKTVTDSMKTGKKTPTSDYINLETYSPIKEGKAVDFMGGTGDMLHYIKNTNAAAYLLVTECGFGELARIKFPKKNFIAMCRLCPYMKSITLESILDALTNPKPELEVTVPAEVAARAKKSIEKMFELAA